MNLTSILPSFLFDFLTLDLSILGGNGYEKI
ncbi:hypothetical protein M060_06350 [Streptococcus mitis 29/42]|uniref:Uncharacterized protein n=1 Tax=Streptococcus mitis 29/42 TaxID=1340486 RepID=S7XFL5_STRMT|nr:hypothetical protein M060_06350 [Streptococcus mitis 29/42]